MTDHDQRQQDEEVASKHSATAPSYEGDAAGSEAERGVEYHSKEADQGFISADHTHAREGNDTNETAEVAEAAHERVSSAHADSPRNATPMSTQSESIAKEEHAEEERAQDVANNVDENFLEHELPSVEALRAARVQLTEQIRHHKDEQDSLALDIECQEGASELYHLAARLHRFEQFCKRAQAHVEGTMTAEVERVMATDKHHSEEEIARFAKELQERRERILKRISTAKEKPVKGHADNAKAHMKEPKLEEADRQTLQHVQEVESSALALDAKVKKFRTMKSKLEAEIIAAERQARQSEERLKQQIKRAQLDNARDTRQCRELNARNATMTAAAQMLMSELNTEHYGIGAIPTPGQLAAQYKALQMSPEPTPKETPPLYPQHADPRHAQNSLHSSARPLHSNSSRQSLSKPPLVAIKSTASQRSREMELKKDRAETAHSSRRSSEYGVPISRRGSEPRLPLHDVASRRSHDVVSQVGSDANRVHADAHVQAVPV